LINQEQIMTAETVTPSIGEKRSNPTNWIQRLGLFVAFLICGTAIFVFGSNYFNIVPTNGNLTYNLILSAILLASALWFRFDVRMNKYWQIPFAFFIASVAFPITSIFGRWSSQVLDWFHVTTATAQGIAIAKVCEMVLVVIPILVLTKISGSDLGTISLKPGNLKLGLSIGALVLFNFASSAFLFFATRYTSTDTLGAAVLWGIVFSFSNGFMEELWLRGIFLKRFVPFLGTGGSVLLTSIVFALMHTGAVYVTPIAIPIMLFYCMTMGLACGYLMMKTDSILGPMLIHTAADFFLFFAMLANV
jgi:membrane protease YdiL (CAAX protease family)